MNEQQIDEISNKIDKVNNDDLIILLNQYTVEQKKLILEYYKNQNKELEKKLEEYRVEIGRIREKIYSNKG